MAGERICTWLNGTKGDFQCTNPEVTINNNKENKILETTTIMGNAGARVVPIADRDHCPIRRQLVFSRLLCTDIGHTDSYIPPAKKHA